VALTYQTCDRTEQGVTCNRKRHGITPRTQALAEDAASRLYGAFLEQRQLDAEYQAPDGITTVLADAQHFAYTFPRLTPVIRDGELIVGALIRSTEDEMPGWLPDGHPEYIDGFAKNTPDDQPELREKAARGLISPQGSLNHKVVDYAGFIRTGSAELAKRAREIASTKSGDDLEFCEAFSMGHEAIIVHAQNYADACEKLAGTSAPERAAELLEIARVCRKVPAHPAETFHEAVQSMWFAYMVANDGVGRIDTYLNDFYQADLAAGRITPDRAQELIECLMIKVHGDCMEGDYNVSSVQTLTLGGMLPDGTDACNDLTKLFLRAIHNIRLLRPTVYVRCCDTTPEDVLDLAVSLLGDGLAEPSFYGDQPIIDGLVRVGIPLEAARDYALSGCTEVVSPGLGAWGAPNGWINMALMIDEALRDCANRGVCDDISIWKAIEEHTEDVAEACRLSNIFVDEAVTSTRYNQTLMMPVTLEKCKDIVHGGAKTYMGHWEAIGLPNAADMIYSAKKICADDNTSLADVYKNLDAGDESLLTKISALPKYGSDCLKVDEIATKLIDLLAYALESRSTPLRPILVLGHLAGGENMHVAYGIRMGATLDGRKAGQTIADSLAGSQGKTNCGPTAVIRSLCRLDHSKLIAGNVSTLRLSPTDFATLEARKNVVSLIRTFVELRGSQLQINVLDAETLREAQDHPEDYNDLLVRVAGYSARFVNIGKRVQDEIIARTEGLAV